MQLLLCAAALSAAALSGVAALLSTQALFAQAQPAQQRPAQQRAAQQLAAQTVTAGDIRPNIVLVVIDDASPTDLGAYGGEIATPNIDRLAARGTRFTGFRATPMCAPSRAMLLTGLDSHVAGLANLPESVPVDHEGQAGYLGRLADNVVTVASLLQRNGYRTYAAGKWHLGHSAGALPGAQGFDHSYVVDATGADNWEQRAYLPIYEDAPWYQDDAPVRLPGSFYSSEFLVDRMIAYINQGAPSAARPTTPSTTTSAATGSVKATPSTARKPFFAYLPFLAIHIPVQAPAEFTAHYNAVYNDGWTAQRQRRYTAAVNAGLIAPGANMRPVPAGLRNWSALDTIQRTQQAKAQAVNAGMMEAMDYHFGRLVAHLKQIGEYDNTLFIVLADNGPEPSDPMATPVFRWWSKSVHYSTDVAQLGTRGTFAAIGPEAANANAAPFALFKFHAAEGGVRVPLIIAGPGIAAGKRHDAFALISDITPTLLEYTQTAAAPAPAPVISGRSLLPVLAGRADHTYAAHEPVAIEAAGSSALYKGALKLVRDRLPFGDERWHLYELGNDPGETNDLAAARPDVLKAMLKDYAEYAARVGVLDVPSGYTTTGEVRRRMVHALVQRHAVLLAISAAALVALPSLLVAWVIRRARRKRAHHAQVSA